MRCLFWGFCGASDFLCTQSTKVKVVKVSLSCTLIGFIFGKNKKQDRLDWWNATCRLDKKNTTFSIIEQQADKVESLRETFFLCDSDS